MKLQNAIASLAVKDVQAATAWYTRMLGRPPDHAPMASVAEWSFPRGGWLQVYELVERAGHCSCTLSTDDIGDVESRLRALGLEADDSFRHNETVSVLMIRDPDGNSIAFAQAHQPGLAK